MFPDSSVFCLYKPVYDISIRKIFRTQTEVDPYLIKKYQINRRFLRYSQGKSIESLRNQSGKPTGIPREYILLHGRYSRIRQIIQNHPDRLRTSIYYLDR